MHFSEQVRDPASACHIRKERVPFRDRSQRRGHSLVAWATTVPEPTIKSWLSQHRRPDGGGEPAPTMEALP